jgi:secreted PhoX family phosphatase
MTQLTRRRFVEGTAAVGAGLALAGPLEALASRGHRGRNGNGARRRHTVAYGQLQPTRELDSGIEFLELPPGFEYRIISKQAQPMDDGNPTPGIFDGMAAYPAHGHKTILIRNHENRSRAGEIKVEVPRGKLHDQDQAVRGGNTKLVVGTKGERELREAFAVLGGTHTNCAGGLTPWNTWITCEEIFNYGSTEDNVTPGTGTPHGYIFEVPADADGPVQPLEVNAAGRFSHEAVAWLKGALYETEDRGDAAFYRFIPDRKPREYGDLASFGGTLQALAVKGRKNFDANSAKPGESHAVDWVTIEEPDPLEDTVRVEAQGKGAAIFDRTEGIWSADKRVYFDCTTGGEAQLGQVWEFKPEGKEGGRLRLIYESTAVEDLENPDNLVVVPATGHVFLQEDSEGEQFVRGVNRRGEIYDFAHTLVNETEFCGGCFSPDGKTFFLNQQGDRQDPAEGGDPLNPPDEEAAITYAIWGPFGGGS